MNAPKHFSSGRLLHDVVAGSLCHRFHKPNKEAQKRRNNGWHLELSRSDQRSEHSAQSSQETNSERKHQDRVIIRKPASDKRVHGQCDDSR